MATLRIAANDPGLAHAAAQAGIAAMHARSEALYKRLSRKSVAEISRTLRKHYADLLLVENIGAAGRRANATWVVLDADAKGATLVPIRITLSYSGLCAKLVVSEYRVQVARHTVARIMQRTLGHDNMHALGDLLLHHIGEASALIDAGTLRRGDQVRTSSPEGALLWEACMIDGRLILRGQTWLAAGTAEDAQVRADCAACKTIVTKRCRST